MNILDNSIFPYKKPISAHGHPIIELWEPESRKVVQKVEGDNMVFTAAMLSRISVFNYITSSYLCLMDNDADIDANFPYLLGQVIGYGIPSNGSSGLYQGAYSSANQVLAEQSMSSIRWKFQYEFTPSQANGVIKSLGLTGQYSANAYKSRPKFSPIYNSIGNNYSTNICDGRYSYSCTASTGIVKKYDNWLGVETSIDVSAIIGKTSLGTLVGYEPANGRFHIWAFFTGASRWYVFSDNTFTSCIANYTASNLTGWSTQNLYISGNRAYQLTPTGAKYVDYVNNIDWVTIPMPAVCNANPIAITQHPDYGTCALYGSIVAGGYGYSNNSSMCVLLDLSIGAFVGHIISPVGWNSSTAAFKVPLLGTNAITANSSNYNGNNGLFNSATAAYKLPTPVTKTSVNGMTVTYELEVFWE